MEHVDNDHIVVGTVQGQGEVILTAIRNGIGHGDKIADLAKGQDTFWIFPERASGIGGQ